MISAALLLASVLELPVDAIRVKVTDADGKAIASARASLTRIRREKFEVGGGGTVSPRRNESGRFTFSDFYEGQYVITVKAPGYCSQQIDVRIVSRIARKPVVHDMPITLKKAGDGECNEK